MIINVRGTHGSGKSTIVRKVMSYYDRIHEIRKQGRTRPFAYELNSANHNLYVPGHYETPCGGCDSIGLVNDYYEKIALYAKNNWDVLFEGILAQHSGPNTRKLIATFKYCICVINVSIEEATQAVNERRQLRGNFKPFDPRNVIKEHEDVIRKAKQLKEIGVPVFIGNREEVKNEVLRLLGLKSGVDLGVAQCE
jgi:hypothetical protein